MNLISYKALSAMKFGEIWNQKQLYSLLKTKKSRPVCVSIKCSKFSCSTSTMERQPKPLFPISLN
jgi:hypothetical protein